MTSETHGWCGKILEIDLTKSKTSELDTMQYAGRFLGGRGIATKIYYDRVTPEAGALDPENLLILMSGPLAATGAQGASRFEVVGKSPMLDPEGFCYGNLGGFFGPALKKAGYDGLVVTGCAERPCYVWIHDGEVEIRDASSLWGKGLYRVGENLRGMHGESVRFVTTGPAGENRCRNATLMTDHEGSATAGFGAVLGSKNLKAIAVVGTGRPAVAQPENLAELNRLTLRLSHRGTLRIPLPKKQMEYVGKASCYQCGLDCIRGSFRSASGKAMTGKCHSLIFYMPWVGMRPDETVDTALDATTLCNDFSFCTMEIDNIMTWLQACHRAGDLTDEDIGLEMSKIGTREFFERLVAMIAHRQGFGDVLAEGLLRAAKHVGGNALAHLTPNMSGSGVGLGGAYAPREYVTTSLLYALEPRQPIAMLHEVSYLIARWLLHRIRPALSPTTAEVFRAAAKRFWRHEEAWDLTSYEGKAQATARIQDRNYVKDSLVLCDAAWPVMDSFETPDHVGDPGLESKLFSAATGVETDEDGLLLYGERVFNLQRGILLREGWQPKLFDAPEEFNFSEPVQTDLLNPQLIVPGPGEEPVSVRGNVLDREKFETMRDEYYQLRGWDPETGLQEMETLERLDLGDLARDLQSGGLVAEETVRE